MIAQIKVDVFVVGYFLFIGLGIYLMARLGKRRAVKFREQWAATPKITHVRLVYEQGSIRELFDADALRWQYDIWWNAPMSQRNYDWHDGEYPRRISDQEPTKPVILRGP